MTDFLAADSGIRQLHARFVDAVWRKDGDSFADCFTEDGEWIARYARARGPAEIAALMDRNIPVEPKRKHFIMNSLIRLEGDRASARTSYLVVLQAAGAALVPSVAGTYQDLLERTAAGWRFRERRLVHDLAGELGLNLPSTRRS